MKNRRNAVMQLSPLLLGFLSLPLLVKSFTTAPTFSASSNKSLPASAIRTPKPNFQQPRSQLSFLRSSPSNEDTLEKTAEKELVSDDDELDQIIVVKAQKHFPSFVPSQIITYTLKEHKPLGCTAEESLVLAGDKTKFVFISKVVEDGNANKAGLEVGDVIVAVSGSFDELVGTFGDGLDRARSLIAGRQENDELTIKVIRGTDVLAKHQTALVDLCVLPEGSSLGRDSNMEKCIETMYNAGYELDDVEGPADCEDSDMECMLDTIADLWNEELNVDRVPDDDNSSNGKEAEKKKPAPWSSRSSPSGTFVRVNGKMVNIDE